jgi:site-specific DNA-methyltransferase (adenine-specific)
MNERAQLIRPTMEPPTSIAVVAPQAHLDLAPERVHAARGIAPSDWYTVDPETLSLRFHPGTPYEAWERETTTLLEVARGIQWLTADALAWGEDRWGERAAQVLDPARYAYDSVVRMARTARAIPPDRRRPTVPFAIHADVAALPVAEQEALLDHGQEHGTRREEMRALVRRTKQRLAREAAALLPAPQLDLDGIVLQQADATALPLPDASVQVILTSPPYGLDGGRHGAKYRVEDAADQWVSLMRGFCSEAWRVLSDQGRLLVNAPLDVSIGGEGGHRPSYAQLVAVALEAGFSYQTTLVWADNQLGKSTARGSQDSPGGVHVVAPCEVVAAFCKGAWIRPPDGRTSDLEHDEWTLWTNGHWVLPGEGRAWEGFEAPFPLELPRRLLKLFSYREDVICDAFLGSGTSAVAAYQLGRRFYGYDLDPLCVASSARRLALVSCSGSG